MKLIFKSILICITLLCATHIFSMNHIDRNVYKTFERSSGKYTLKVFSDNSVKVYDNSLAGKVVFYKAMQNHISDATIAASGNVTITTGNRRSFFWVKSKFCLLLFHAQGRNRVALYESGKKIWGMSFARINISHANLIGHSAIEMHLTNGLFRVYNFRNIKAPIIQIASDRKSIKIGAQKGRKYTKKFDQEISRTCLLGNNEILFVRLKDKSCRLFKLQDLSQEIELFKNKGYTIVSSDMYGNRVAFLKKNVLHVFDLYGEIRALGTFAYFQKCILFSPCGRYLFIKSKKENSFLVNGCFWKVFDLDSNGEQILEVDSDYIEFKGKNYFIGGSKGKKVLYSLEAKKAIKTFYGQCKVSIYSLLGKDYCCAICFGKTTSSFEVYNLQSEIRLFSVQEKQDCKLVRWAITPDEKYLLMAFTDNRVLIFDRTNKVIGAYQVKDRVVRINALLYPQITVRCTDGSSLCLQAPQKDRDAFTVIVPEKDSVLGKRKRLEEDEQDSAKKDGEPSTKKRKKKI